MALDKNGISVGQAVIGQEAICSDGLGRVKKVIWGVAGSAKIQVDTYYSNRSCCWASHNVELIDPRK